MRNTEAKNGIEDDNNSISYILHRMDSFNTLILGGGPGGIAAAKILARAGKSVALISDDLGGECLNYGCIPTKTYLWTAELFEKIREAENFGIEIPSPRIQWQKLKERKNDVVSKLKKNLKFTLEKLGVKIIEGRGILEDSHAIRPSRSEAKQLMPRRDVGATIKIIASNQQLSADYLILATGSEPIFPNDFEPSDRVLSSRAILDLPEIPKSLFIIGGGAVGCEFASVFASFDTEVAIAEANQRLLPNEDAEISAELERVFSRKKIKVLKNTRVTPEDTKAYEKVLVAIGRKPNFASLGMSREKLNEPHIFIIGDLANHAMLAYTAEREGENAAAKILGKSSAEASIDYSAVPNTVFCLPEIASVGLTEEETKKRGIEYITGKALYSANAKALIISGRDGFAKIIAEKNTGRLLGAHIIGEKATELIAEASLAITLHLSLNDFLKNLHSHPILGEILKEACLDCES